MEGAGAAGGSASRGVVLAVTILVVARLLINWVTVPTAIWLVGVASLAAAVFGAVLRWPALAWFRARTRDGGRWVSAPPWSVAR